MSGKVLRPLLVILGLGWLALEVWLYYLLGTWLGAVWVIVALVVGALLGTAAIRVAGRRAMRSLQAAAEEAVRQAQREQGAEPTEAEAEAEAAPEPAPKGGDTALTVLGGVLLIIPTFATDVLGLLFVFPPTRFLLRRGFGEVFAGRLLRRTPFGRAMADARAMGDQMRIHRPGVRIVPGEVNPEASPEDAAEPMRIIEGTVISSTIVEEPGSPKDGKR